ncbi:hypothetical protein Ancab_002754 [Ancistrocladus abbreviatus]
MEFLCKPAVVYHYTAHSLPTHFSSSCIKQALWGTVEHALGPGLKCEKCEMALNAHSTAVWLQQANFRGIGVPSVAASSAIVANSVVSVSQHSGFLTMKLASDC